MSYTVYYTAEKNEDVLAMIAEVNSDPDQEIEYVEVDAEWGIDDDEFVVHTEEQKVLLCPKDKRRSTAEQRASLSGWRLAPMRMNITDAGSVKAAVEFVAYMYD